MGFQQQAAPYALCPRIYRIDRLPGVLPFYHGCRWNTYSAVYAVCAVYARASYMHSTCSRGKMVARLAPLQPAGVIVFVKSCTTSCCRARLGESYRETKDSHDASFPGKFVRLSLCRNFWCSQLGGLAQTSDKRAEH
jgi:hypothetical protein